MSAPTAASVDAVVSTTAAPDGDEPRPRLPPPVRDEAQCVQSLLAALRGLDWAQATAPAHQWVAAVRQHKPPFWAMESLLAHYPISSAEGLALMRLAEALLRVPDRDTAAALAADQLGRAAFDSGDDPPWLAQLSAQAVQLARKLLPDADAPGGLLARLGANAVVAAAVRAVRLLGQQFVLGETLPQALARADAQRRDQPRLRFSFDMLGEGARSEADAQRYFAAYAAAIERLAAQPAGGGPAQRDGVSVKLSALDPRFEELQRQRVFAVLLPRLEQLARAAAAADINFTLDAEESDRLELTLDVLDALLARLAQQPALQGWSGLGLAVQAYQTRAIDAVQAVVDLARRHQRPLMVRLVKGAYWDAEIKRAQELGLAGYPVFTRKRHTDVSYLACAKVLLTAASGPQPAVYAQFATHNAATIAAILHLAAQHDGARLELQKLHGMGDGVYREVLAHTDVPCRVYAPVGAHRDLLAYLVRRLLENGANTSFVHQLADEGVAQSELLASPLAGAADAALPPPAQIYGDLYGQPRRNPQGLDLADARSRSALRAAWQSAVLPAVREASVQEARGAMQALAAAFPAWDATPVAQRAAAVLRAGDRLEQRLPEFAALIVREAHKTWGDAVAEVREAIDYCRYYALLAQHQLREQVLPGPTGEANTLRLRGRGAMVCISPWNFPLAIFAGQLLAALLAGNTVAAKPAEQTPAVAQAFVDLLIDAGVPRSALALLHGPGETVGAALVADPHCAGVLFTGSTAVAHHIHRALAAKDGPIVPLVAETGGINAMIVDSTALPEQVVDAVVQSAFRSAGQRCSALRVLCLHAAIADEVEAMLAGAMQALRIGPPEDFDSDVGPVIDAAAWATLREQLQRLEDAGATLLARTPWPDGGSEPARVLGSGAHAQYYLAPCAWRSDLPHLLREEIFGPVLQIVHWDEGGWPALVDAINAWGYGLTLGIQTRIDGRAAAIAARARVGNVYVNRGMTGAVVGVQPFGGEGLSGTGPKAGGPHLLARLCAEQTVSINTAAAGGNAALLAAAAK